jgi:uncharacterized membrane protein
MSFQERRAIAALVSITLTSIIYFGDVFRRFLERGPDAGSDFAFWGAAILLFMPVSVFFNVAVTIVFTIINTITQGEQEPPITDERDQMVELKATRNFFLVFIVGFMLTMGVLAVGNPPGTMFIMLLFILVASGAMLEASKFIYYRRGV